jgi:hypothetical protein
MSYVCIVNLEAVKCQDIESQAKQDLVDLGLVLLDCMEGHVLPAEKRQQQFVKEQRKNNKVFGLSKAELWSGSKQLIDFLDELFDDERSACAKQLRPVSCFM